MAGPFCGPVRAALLAVICVVGVACAASPAPDPLAGTYSVMGGGAPLKVFQALSDEFVRRHPAVSFHFEDIGSGPGMTRVASGEADLGTSSAEPPASLEAEVRLLTVGASGTGIVTAPANRVSGLTRDQVRDIFSGQITDWAAVGGDPGKIIVALRPKGSAIRKSFEAYAFANTTPTYAKDSFEVDDMDQMISAVSGRREVVGMLTFDETNLADKRVRFLALDGVKASKESLASGTYPMRRPLYLVYRASGVKPTIEAFLEFVRSPDGQRIIGATSAS